jgi:tRNA (guanine37-N1)-methyltransferase
MRVDIVTIFPDYLSPLDLSLIGRARSAGVLDVAVHDLRRWTHDVHRTVDDTPYGGGPGMVMRPEPWGEALDALTGPAEPGCEPAAGDRPRLVVPSPAGVPFTQALAHELAGQSRLIFACGRYEGIDQRVLDDAARLMPVTEVSLGDYVLFGGEVAVLVILEAVVRLLPGVLGNADSLVEESHADGLLEAPVYTKPPTWRELPVPEILRSGDHARIARWRRDQALLRTARRRPDLLAGLASPGLDRRDRDVLRDTGFQISPGDMAE